VTYGHMTRLEHILTFQREGSKAFREGKSLEENPYRPTDPERPTRHSLWAKGWESARLVSPFGGEDG